MCYGMHCPHEIHSGPDAGECILPPAKRKCPESPEDTEYRNERDRLYDLINRIGDLVGMYLPPQIHKELDRLICDAQLSDDYRTRVQELETEITVLKGEELPF
jgi:hypothetical protein